MRANTACVARLRLDWLKRSCLNAQAAALVVNGRVHTSCGLPVAQVQANPDHNAEALVPIC